MKWQFWLGRTLIALATLVLALFLLVLAFFGGAVSDSGFFGETYSSGDTLSAQLELLAAGTLLVMSGFAFRRNIRWVLWTIIAVSGVGLIMFSASDGLSSDIYAVIPAYLVIWLGYWLSKKGIAK